MALRKLFHLGLLLGASRHLHISTTRLLPRRRPGTRKPLPEEEVKRRVQEIVYRDRRREPDEDDFFSDIGNYDVPEEEIQQLYQQYRKLYHPELDEEENKANEENKGKEENKAKDGAHSLKQENKGKEKNKTKDGGHSLKQENKSGKVHGKPRQEKGNR